MAFDEKLAGHLRDLLSAERKVTEKKMFGGLAFLVNGNMCVSASGKGDMLVRIDPAETKAALARPHVTRMVMGGRSMDGWIRVSAASTKREIEPWIKRSLAYVKTLPPK